MLKWWTFLILVLMCRTVFGQDPSLRYATEPDLATAQALSAAAWAAVRCSPQPACDVQQVTNYVYPIVGLTDGIRYAIVIHTGDVYQGEHLSLPNGKSFNLTPSQIASLATRAGMGTLLPDILSVALLNSRITTPEFNAATAYANTHPAFKVKWNLVLGGPSDLEGTNIWDVLNELQTAGILTADRVLAITQPNPAAAVVPP